MAPFQFGAPPHVHHELDEIMLVLDGIITVLEGDQLREIPTGGYHFRPRGVIHTFWNAHGEPACFLNMYPGTQDFVHYLEELSDLGRLSMPEFAPESLARFKALDARHMAKYGPKG